VIEPGSLEQAQAALTAGATLVTASARQSRHLLEEEGLRALRQGRAAWRPGDILPWDAWLHRLHAGALAGGGAGRVPALLSEAQALALWQQVIEEDFQRRRDAGGGELLQPMAAARLAGEARQLALAWGLDIGRLQAATHSDDSAAFLRWSREWERQLAAGAWLEVDALADAAVQWLQAMPLLRPAALWLAGFEELTPQQHRLCTAIAELGIPVRDAGFPESPAASAHCVACDDQDHEAAAAARWARERLDSDPGQRLAIVVPDLAARRGALERALAAELDPAAWWGDERSPPPWNLSLGLPLLKLALVHDALLLLELAGEGLDFPDASRLLRSPFLGAAITEAGPRLQLDRLLRRRRLLRVTLPALRRLAAAGQPTGLDGLLAGAAAAAGVSRHRPPGDWAEAFAAQLQAAGWPGPRALDSSEYQALQAWLALLREFAGLGSITGVMDRATALGWLRRMATARPFQPQGASAPVQVLGMLEALGQRFDGVWLMGLHDEAWPAPARPNPLLPLHLQRELGLPRSSAARELEFAGRMTALLLRAAPGVVASWPRQVDERRLRVSPLVAALPAGDAQVPGNKIHAMQPVGSATEDYIDEQGPPLDSSGRLPGSGTRALVDYSQCPFRSFAAHRLNAAPLEEPGPGLDAAGRGLLVHAALERLWGRLGDRASLAALNTAERRQLLAEVVAGALTSLAGSQPALAEVHFRKLEQRRLEDLLEEWLPSELARQDFRVVAREEVIAIEAGPLRLRGRVDRIDELPDGSRVLIDYKTGKLNPGDWLGERPRDPQLPIYALALQPGPDALAVAQLRAGACRWSGVARDAGLVPGVPACGEGRGAFAALDWDALAGQWQEVALGLAEGLAAGHAAVSPLRGACRYCDQVIFCRINEIKGVFAGRSPDADGVDDEQPAG